ncbi:TonB family protein [bacterium]
MYIRLNYYKDKFKLAFFISLFLHIAALSWFVYCHIDKVIDYREVTIDEVEFLEKSKVLKKLRKKKKKLRKKEDFKPLLEEKILRDKKDFKTRKLDLLKDKKLEKPKTMRSLELKKDLLKKDIKIKEMEAKEMLIDKKRPVVEAHELKALITMEEVGDKKISAKTLDLLNKVKKQVRVKPDLEAKVSLEEKEDKLKRLDRKLSSMDAPPVINMTERSLDRVQTLDLDTDRKKSVSVQSGGSQEILLLKEKASGPSSRKRAISGKVDTRPVKIVESKVLDLEEEKKKKEIKISVKKDEKKDVKMQEMRRRRKKKKSKGVEITGAIKNRKLLFSPIPQYPEWAKNQGIEAIIHVYLEVNSLGKVINESIRIEITSGYEGLDTLVTESLKTWKFEALENSNEVQNGIVVFRFKLT